MLRSVDHADYAAATAELRRQLLAYAAAAWATINLTDEGLQQLVGLMVPTVQATQTHVASLTSIYFTEKVGAPEGLADDILTGRGVDPETVYARPVITARSELAKGKPVAKALEAGERRLQNIAGTDLQMAKVRQTRESLRETRVQFYRRVLTGSENCAMCMIAATQRYRKADLLPLHPGCDCNTDVIPPGMDLDQTLDVDLLNATHERVKEFTDIADRGGRAVDYRKLIVSHEHGEVGPVLGWHGQKFTSKADLR